MTLRERFEEETGREAINKYNVLSQYYCEWLEKRLIESEKIFDDKWTTWYQEQYSLDGKLDQAKRIIKKLWNKQKIFNDYIESLTDKFIEADDILKDIFSVGDTSQFMCEKIKNYFKGNNNNSDTE